VIENVVKFEVFMTFKYFIAIFTQCSNVLYMLKNAISVRNTLPP